MNKRGQVTIFIILAIIILAGIIAFFILRNNSNETDIFSSSGQTSSINKFIESCFEEIISEAFLLISFQGGYYNVPEPKKQLGPLLIPYYLYEGKFNVPQIEEIEGQISSYIEENSERCLNNISGNYELKNKGEPNTNSKFEENELKVKVNFPLIFTKENEGIKIDEFKIEKQTKFLEHYNNMLEFLEEQQQNKNELPIGSLNALALSNGYIYSIFDEDDEILFTFHFIEPDETILTYNFFIKYNWGENEK